VGRAATRPPALAARAGLAVLCALSLAACGAAAPAGRATPAKARSATARHHVRQTLVVYSSLPLSGSQRPASLQIERGIELALTRAHHRAGRFDVVYRALSDSLRRVTTTASASTTGRGRLTAAKAHHYEPTATWQAMATVDNAVAAARDPETVAYIGELDSGATELSLPILNQAGIVELTPGSGYPGLTDRVAGVTAAGEPGRYYPHGGPTLLRLIPDDVVEAAAIVDFLKHDTSCTHVAAAAFGGGVSAGPLVAAIQRTAPLYGLTFEATAAPGANPKNYYSYAVALRDHGVNCFVLSGRVTRAAIAFTEALNAQLPVGSAIFGTSGLCNRGWSDRAYGGVPLKVANALYCATPLRPVDSYIGGRSFARSYRAAEHASATAEGYYGYLATRLVLEAIAQIGASSDSRHAVLENLIGNLASTELETYGFDSADGEISSTYYEIDKVTGGLPLAYRAIDPPSLLPETPGR
jgi:branched-chain amino acid transport system substrate-binding protein